MVKKKKSDIKIFKFIGIFIIIIVPIFFNLGNLRSIDEIPLYGSGITKDVFVIGFPAKYIKISYKDCHIPLIVNPDGSRYIPDNFECGYKTNTDFLQFVFNLLLGLFEGLLLVLFYFKTKIDIRVKILATILFFIALQIIAILV